MVSNSTRNKHGCLGETNSNEIENANDQNESSDTESTYSGFVDALCDHDECGKSTCNFILLVGFVVFASFMLFFIIAAIYN